ncbi:IucA/IucC family protein [Streptomyces sp. NPDC101151]|uniref:IucA/IucC family protein n=1 Tax=Streptomyces sp. NPDC101151 TaxID=3366115 RepID=UPI00381FB377
MYEATIDATLAELGSKRPDLLQPFMAALPGARATVLARLWGAFGREPLPGLTARWRDAETLIVDLRNGGRLTGAEACSRQFAPVPDDFTVAGPEGPIREPGELLAQLDLGTCAASRLVAELDNSVVNLALARAANGHRDVPSALRDSVDAEQAVVDGHPQHPCCRTRSGMSVADVLAYAPEHHPVIELALLPVPAERWLGAGSWPEELRDGGTFLLPIHPWQRDHVLVRHPDLAPTRRTIRARPLLSLRTLAPGAGLAGRHIKTSLDVQVTNYLRTISPAEVADGPPLSELVSAVLDKAGFGEDLGILRELGGGAVRVDGQASASLASMVRESTDSHLGVGEVAVPLTAVHATGAAAVVGDPVHWLADLAELLLPPVLTLLSMGVALEAHGQNTLVVMRDGRPVRILYRDLDGVRVSPRRLADCGFTLPVLAGSRACNDVGALHSKLFGALLSGVFSELVDVLARTRSADPAQLWATVADVGRSVYSELPDRDDAAAFFGATLPLKATIAMRLAGDPGRARWTAVPNPLALHR